VIRPELILFETERLILHPAFSKSQSRLTAKFPPIDWSKIKTEKDLDPLVEKRNQYPAEIIKTQIFAKNKKALVIYGAFHLHGEGSLREQVDSIRPGAFFVVTLHTGYDEGLCARCFEQAARDWPQPAFATSVGESSLEFELLVQGCNFVPLAAIGLANMTAAEKAKGSRHGREALRRRGRCAPIFGASRKSYPSSGIAGSLSRF
jgi:hypothetical protein